MLFFMPNQPSVKIAGTFNDPSQNVCFIWTTTTLKMQQFTLFLSVQIIGN